jgi:hypothetical protein
MSYFFGDGFDLYTNFADCLSHWDPVLMSTNYAFNISATGRFTGSRSLVSSTTNNVNPALSKTSNVNDGMHHFSFAIRQDSLSNSNFGFFVVLLDGAVPQCSFTVALDGRILFYSGSLGTLLATFTGAVPSINTWYQFEVEIVVHSSSGSVAVRRNGNIVNDFFVGSLNTRAGTTNNYANRIGLNFYSAAATQIVDDFLWRSESAIVPWIGDIRCYTRMPSADAAVQWSRNATTSSQQVTGTVGVSTTWSANQAIYVPFVATFNGLVTAASVDTRAGGGTGHLKFAIFSNSGGTAGTVLATSSELTNPTSTITQVPFPTPVHITVGQTYWLGLIQDANINYYVINSNQGFWSSTISYATWPISSPGGTPFNFNHLGLLTVYVTPSTNSDCVSEAQQDALANYVYSSTNGQADFYSIGSISTIPVATHGITTRAYMQKNDAGTRLVSVQLKSGGTTVQSANLPLNTSWNWVSRVDTVDPATGVAWTPTAVNAVTVGPLVTA